MMSIYEVIALGPICAGDEETGIIISVNGAYLNACVSRGNNQWENTDCRARNKDLYNTVGSDMIDEAEEYLEDILNGDEEEDDEEEGEEEEADEE